MVQHYHSLKKTGHIRLRIGSSRLSSWSILDEKYQTRLLMSRIVSLSNAYHGRFKKASLFLANCETNVTKVFFVRKKNGEKKKKNIFDIDRYIQVSLSVSSSRRKSGKARISTSFVILNSRLPSPSTLYHRTKESSAGGRTNFLDIFTSKFSEKENEKEKSVFPFFFFSTKIKQKITFFINRFRTFEKLIDFLQKKNRQYCLGALKHHKFIKVIIWQFYSDRLCLQYVLTQSRFGP